MDQTQTLIRCRAEGDALEVQCLAGNLARYAKTTGDLLLLRTAKAVQRTGRQMAQHINGVSEAA